MENIIWIENVQDENAKDGDKKAQDKDKIDLIFLYAFIGICK
jgi:hypothetical protein